MQLPNTSQNPLFSKRFNGLLTLSGYMEKADQQYPDIFTA
jgi:hypothetical protein